MLKDIARQFVGVVGPLLSSIQRERLSIIIIIIIVVQGAHLQAHTGLVLHIDA